MEKLLEDLYPGKDINWIAAYVGAAYQEPWRFYHNINHIDHCLKEYEMVEKAIINKSAVLLAIWYHDVIYLPGSRINERASGDVALVQLSTLAPADKIGHHVRRLIVGSRDRGIRSDARYFHDIDYSILGQDRDTYTRYVEAIYRENMVLFDVQDIKARRKIFLLKLLSKRIFQSEFFRGLYEQQAKANIKYELEHPIGVISVKQHW
jgi:predicted metal-dependent HD superfamily phosphohydrolase